MRRRHVFLTDAQLARIEKDTQAKEDVTLSSIVRRALDEYYEKRPAKRRRAERKGK